MKRPKAVLFDMDGVLFDSERLLRECWLQLAREQGLTGMREVYARCIGVNAPASDRILREAYGADFPARAFKERARDIYRGRCAREGLPLKPCARELLEALRDEGIPRALASSTGEELVRRELEEAELLSLFDTLVTGDMVRRGKPDPECFLLAAERLGVKPEDCAVIEDSYNGVRAAHAAGAKAIMVPDLLEPNEEMARLAEAIVPDLEKAGAVLGINIK